LGDEDDGDEDGTKQLKVKHILGTVLFLPSALVLILFYLLYMLYYVIKVNILPFLETPLFKIKTGRSDED